MKYIIILLICGVLIEALVELIKSGFFESFRNLLGRHRSRAAAFFYKVVNCGYCSSVWVAASITIVLFFSVDVYLTGISFLDLFITFILSHRISNFIHDFWDRYISKQVSFGDKE